jgi:putative FmdB family regulatory protein
MPIYEFACGDCGTTFEKRVSFSAVAAPACDSCRSDNVRRQLSKPAIHFKGSGWYITDNKKSTNGNGKESSAKKATETSDVSRAPASDTTSGGKNTSDTTSHEKSAVTA